MTGNKNMWRAPLAGLASLAMVATMGVAASTANAASYDTATLSVNGVGVSTGATLYAGETIADALGTAANGFNYTTALLAPSAPTTGKVFGGWGLNGSATPVDLSSKLPAGATNLTPIWYDADYASGKSDVIKVTYGTTVSSMSLLAGAVNNGDGTYSVYVKKGSIPAQLLPVDKADGKVITKYNVDTSGKQVKVAASDLATVTAGNPDVGNEGIIVGVDAANDIADVAQLHVDASDAAYSTYGYPVGAKSDGDSAAGSEHWYTVDAKADGTAVAPAWFTAPVSGVRKTVSEWVSRDGATYAPGKSVPVKAETFLSPAKASVSEGYTVTFVVDGTIVATDFVAKDSDNPYVKAPTAPTKDGYAFAGWKDAATGTVYADESKDQDTTTHYLSELKITSNKTFEAQWNSRKTQVKVTFKDAAYDGANKSESVLVDVPGFLSADKAPSWTRKGYIFDKWVEDKNGNGQADSTETEYDWNKQITDATANFTLVATWEKATADKAKAALEYVDAVDDGAADTYEETKDATNNGDYNVNDGSDFTAASWAAYVNAYKPLREQYLNDVYNNPNTGVQAEASAEIVNGINKALAGLKFKSNSKVAAPVYRLRTGTWDNGRHHLWTTDRNEVNTLTKTTHTNGAAGWILEDTAFTALNTKASADRANNVTGTTDYKNAEKYVDAPEGVNAIAENVYRLNSDITKEHLYTTDYNEYDTLGNNGWQQEDVAFIVPVYNGTDVYRVYIPSTLQHLWTRNVNEYNTLTQQHPATYQAEGIKFQAL